MNNSAVLARFVALHAVHAEDDVADLQIVRLHHLRELRHIFYLAGESVRLQSALALLLVGERAVFEIGPRVDARLAEPQVGPPPARRAARSGDRPRRRRARPSTEAASLCDPPCRSDTAGRRRSRPALPLQCGDAIARLHSRRLRRAAELPSPPGLSARRERCRWS